MKARDLRATIRGFLELVEESSGPAAEREDALVRLLDELAVATHTAPRGACSTDEQAPRREYAKLRASIAPLFPNFGLYRAAGMDPGDELLVGDAIDDVTDIAVDLSEVAWLWEHVGEAEALWQFHFGFDQHWGSHLRALQAYIHERSR